MLNLLLSFGLMGAIQVAHSNPGNTKLDLNACLKTNLKWGGIVIQLKNSANQVILQELSEPDDI